MKFVSRRFGYSLGLAVTLPMALVLLQASSVEACQSGGCCGQCGVGTVTQIAEQAEEALPEATILMVTIEGKGEMKGMVCAGCARKVHDAIKGVEGVKEVEVSLKKQQAVVSVNDGVSVEDPTLKRKIKRAVKGAGFRATKVEAKDASENGAEKEERGSKT